MAITFPPIYLLPTHIATDVLHELEDQIPTITYDITEAKIVLGKVSSKQRALFELRSRKLWTEEVVKDGGAVENESPVKVKEVGLPQKRRKIDNGAAKEIITMDSSTESEDEGVISAEKVTEASHINDKRTQSQNRSSPPAAAMSSPLVEDSEFPSATTIPSQTETDWGSTIKVVKLAWYEGCIAAGQLIPMDGYLVYEGKQIPKPSDAALESRVAKVAKRPVYAQSILSRAKEDAPEVVQAPYSKKGGYKRTSQHSQSSQSSVTRPTHLLHQTTSEHDDPARLPPLPDYLHTTFSCQRPTPLYSSNDPFISLLKKIKLARVLTGDEIGVRAYSTSIASLAAYPYTLTSTQEILRLPGCDQKIALLYQEWKEEGQIAAVNDIDEDPKLKVLGLFYEIWGVGATTARDFYNKGWRELDDIVEYGWSTLTRVQQIGLKYYDEFQQKIPRNEVERIGNIILEHANKIHKGFQLVIVGGYRRGKSESGDVDVVLTHPDENFTMGFVQDIVQALEDSKWITHTLTLSLANTERNQTPVSWKGEGPRRRTGFDTLDKALVVWQDPTWSPQTTSSATNPKPSNPNIHRRVDIIISPWKTAGCAVLGWTSGTTFQRDMRRWAKTRGLKFDSSGIRSREDGRWVDIEGRDGNLDLLTKEKMVFERLGLVWREPWERCTG